MSKHAIAMGTALALVSGPALADLTAEEVWADWQRVYAALGGELTATADYAGGTLTLSDLNVAMNIGGIDSTTGYGSLALIEQGDGTIRVEVPETITSETVTTVEGETITQTMTMSFDGLETIIREDGDNRIYEMVATSMNYAFDSPELDDDTAPFTGSITLTDVDTTYTNSEAGDRLITDQVLTASGMTFSASADDPSAPFSMDYTLTDLSSDISGSMNLAETAGAAMSLSAMGLIMTGGMDHGGSILTANGMSENGPVEVSGVSAGGRLAFDISEDSFGYTLSSTEAQMTLELAAFPLPINLSMAEATTGFGLPVGVSDEPKPFALTLAYRDLVVDDTLWSLFDPTGQLPRDAATIMLDLTGTAEMKADIFGDPEALAGLGGPPGELRSMNLNQLDISAAGAQLQGTGAVTFPNPGPIPMPVGSVNLTLDGGFALLDSLVALGFVPAEQAGFVRGMAGMVARPVGNDSLESEIVFTETGGITANGMPLR